MNFCIRLQSGAHLLNLEKKAKVEFEARQKLEAQQILLPTALTMETIERGKVYTLITDDDQDGIKANFQIIRIIDKNVGDQEYTYQDFDYNKRKFEDCSSCTSNNTKDLAIITDSPFYKRGDEETFMYKQVVAALVANYADPIR